MLLRFERIARVAEAMSKIAPSFGHLSTHTKYMEACLLEGRFSQAKIHYNEIIGVLNCRPFFFCLLIKGFYWEHVNTVLQKQVRNWPDKVFLAFTIFIINRGAPLLQFNNRNPLKDRNLVLVSPASAEVGETELKLETMLVGMNESHSYSPAFNRRFFDVCFYNKQTIRKTYGSKSSYYYPKARCLFSPKELIKTIRKSLPKGRYIILPRAEDKPIVGDFNGLHVAILTLVRRGAASISLIGFDLQMTILRTNGYYQEAIHDTEEAIVATKKQFLLSSKQHNPIVQFQVLECLWKLKVFSPDARLESILESGIENYLETLESIYEL